MQHPLQDTDYRGFSYAWLSSGQITRGSLPLLSRFILSLLGQIPQSAPSLATPMHRIIPSVLHVRDISDHEKYASPSNTTARFYALLVNGAYGRKVEIPSFFPLTSFYTEKGGSKMKTWTNTGWVFQCLCSCMKANYCVWVAISRIRRRSISSMGVRTTFPKTCLRLSVVPTHQPRRYVILFQREKLQE